MLLMIVNVDLQLSDKSINGLINEILIMRSLLGQFKLK